jgi:hypothetical protein
VGDIEVEKDDGRATPGQKRLTWILVGALVVLLAVGGLTVLHPWSTSRTKVIRSTAPAASPQPSVTTPDRASADYMICWAFGSGADNRNPLLIEEQAKYEPFASISLQQALDNFMALDVDYDPGSGNLWVPARQRVRTVCRALVPSLPDLPDLPLASPLTELREGLTQPLVARRRVDGHMP